MGFAVPAALGVQVARPDLRPVVLVGDGAFQMTGMELSTHRPPRLRPIVIVLDNDGYGTERLLHPGDHEFNDIHPWQYHKLPEVSAAAPATRSAPKGEFDAALQHGLGRPSGMSLIHVHLDPADHSPALERLTKRLAATWADIEGRWGSGEQGSREPRPRPGCAGSPLQAPCSHATTNPLPATKALAGGSAAM